MKKLKKFIKEKLNIELIFSGRTFYRIWNTLKGTIFPSGAQDRPIFLSHVTIQREDRETGS